MNFFAWPVERLQRVRGNPRVDRSVHEELMKSRRAQLEQLRLQIVNALDVPEGSRVRVAASIVVLPGVGMLLLNDEIVDIKRVMSSFGGRITIVPDAPLQPLTMQKSMAIAGTARQWHLTLIKKPPLLRGGGATIGVIDTGCVNNVFPDLAGFNPLFAEFHPEQPAQGGNPGQPAQMVQTTTLKDFDTVDFHGSTVCAFLAGQTSGVAPGATVVVAAIPVGLPQSNQTTWVMALEWLLDQHCDVITTSLQTGNQGALPLPSTTLAAVDQAIFAARSENDVVVTAAIGNSGVLGNHQHPGLSEFAIGVGAVKESKQRYGSAWGQIANGSYKPDIVAPGQQLELPLSTGFIKVGGTSFATPIVAGALALILERDSSLRGKPDLLTKKLLQHFQPVVFYGPPAQVSVGVGLLDLSSLSRNT